ncbi:MAB_1171c family putative transporter [Planomonospora sp. ID82291]|uniref:MAB_1171c family putative transporter n=1 Tax=Planomonospora sp. ID82291 TaxID=2738136 RepID=UPI0018C3AAA1|nr:MAB_1171c family putative transporter [Planomonospora sp. ID82291]MBG0818926.1 hypothetical protein [Planomonospora sp. ID82291]
MAEARQYLVLAVLWAVVVWRAPAVRRSNAARSLWLTFLSLAVGWTLTLPPVADWFNALVGWEFTPLAKRVAITVGAASIAAFTMAVTGRNTRIVWFAAAATGWALVIAHNAADHKVGEMEDWDGSAAAGWYFGVFDGFLGLALAVSGYASLRYALGRDSSGDPGTTRLGMGILGVGMLIGIGSPLYTLYALLIAGPGFLKLTQARWVMAACLLLCTLGTCIPAVATGWRRLQLRRTVRALRPLHAELTRLFPDTVMAAATADEKLVRHTVEIREALVALTPYGPGPLSESDAQQAARWVADAAAAYRRGERSAAPAGAVDVAEQTAPTRTSIEAEAAWLAQVARAYVTLPRPQ